MAAGKDFRDRFKRLREKLERFNAGTADPGDGMVSLALLAELEGIVNEYDRERKTLESARKEQKQRSTRLARKVEGSEQERKASEQRYRILFDALADMVVVMDQDGLILDANRAACRRLGYSRRELIRSKTLFDLIPEEERDVARKRLDILGDKNELSFEARCLDRKGDRIPVEVNARVIDSGDGRTILATGRDITLRKETSEALQNQMFFAQALMDAAPAPIFYKNPTGVFLGCNAAFAELIGVSKKEILGRTMFEITNRELAQLYSEKDTQLLERGGTQAYEFQGQSANGEKYDALISKAAFRDTTGKVAGLVGVLLDITERKQAEQVLNRARLDLEHRVRERTIELTDAYSRLADSEQKYRTLYEQAGEGILLVDAEGRVQEANPASLALFEAKLSQIVGAKLDELVCGDSHEALSPLLECGVGGSVERRELRISCSCSIAGSGVYAEASATRLEEGRILVMLRDVTNRRRIREELLQAKIAAEDANQAKSEFLANMSHEIRTPISGILGVTDMGLSMQPGPNMADLLNNIRKATNSLLEIVNDILDFSKIEARKLELHEAPFNLQDRLDRLTEVHRPRAEDKGLVLAVVAPSRDLLVYGDAGRLDQVLSNLLSNAIKFTEQGRVDLRVEIEDEDEEGVGLKFVVSDTGSGIPDHKKKLLFKTFSQLEKGSRRSYGGAGLGLAISRRLVELMNGSIWLEEAEGPGATFAFRVRLAWAGQTGEHRAEVAPKVAEIRPARQGRRVLLAEDNLINQEFLAHFLEEAGHSVLVAENGRKALEALEKETFDLVLMDVQMPVMDGLEATRRIRSHSAGLFDPAVPVVALTAYAMKGDKERILKAGMTEYLSKPVDMEALYAVIDRLTAGKE